jgi:hypothetical protein
MKCKTCGKEVEEIEKHMKEHSKKKEVLEKKKKGSRE